MPKLKNKALYLCVVAITSALLCVCKLALAVIPNVEVITLLIAVFACTWGLYVTLPAVAVFIACDTLIWGMGTWVISYVIHWNVVAIAFYLLSKLKTKGWVTVVANVSLAVVLCAVFGVLTSFVDTIIGYVPHQGFYNDWSNVLSRFSVMYLSGITFYVTQIVTNAVTFSVLFVPLTKLMNKIKTSVNV